MVHPTLYRVHDHLSMRVLKLCHASYLSPRYQCVHCIRFRQTHYSDWILPTRVWICRKQVRNALAIALSWTGVALNALKLSQRTDIFKHKFANWKWCISLKFFTKYYNSIFRKWFLNANIWKDIFGNISLFATSYLLTGTDCSFWLLSLQKLLSLLLTIGSTWSNRAIIKQKLNIFCRL